MSPLWRDQLTIALSPHQVDLVRVGKGLRPKVIAKHSELCEGHTWQSAIAAMNKLLTKQTKADISIILSSRYAHLVTVPWSDAISGKEELAALAHHRCSQVYGPMATDWEIRVSANQFGAPMLACGVDRALLNALQKNCTGAGRKLVSIQPSLMAAFNPWHKLVTEKGGWFGVVEGGRLTLALAKNNGWHAVQSRQIEGELAEALPQLLEQEKLLCELADVPRTAWIFAPEEPKLAFAAGGNWSIHTLKLNALEGYAPLNDVAFGLALAGVV